MSVFVQWLLLAAVIDNVVLTRLLGLPSLALHERTRTRSLRRLVVVTGLALTLMLPAIWVLGQWVLQPLGVDHLRVVFVTLLAVMCGLIAARLPVGPRPSDAGDPEALLGIGTAVVLGAALAGQPFIDSLLQALAAGIGAAVGFAAAVYALDALGERVAQAPVPTVFRGLPIHLLTAGLFALGLGGFASA